MTITLNGEKRELQREVNISDLLDIFSLPSERIAIEVNKSVVRKKDWQDVKINDADKIEIIHFVGGG